MSGHNNPYRSGSLYFGLFAFIQKVQVFTKAALLDHAIKSLKSKASAAISAVNVVISPTLEKSGNASSHGEVYYIERLPRKEVKGVKQDKTYRLRWRVKPLVAKRLTKGKVAPKKVAKKVAKKPAKAVAAPASPAVAATA
jgi:hypothetical protein